MRRILPYLKPYLGSTIIIVLLAALDGSFTVASPLLFRVLIDNGVIGRHEGVIIGTAVAAAGLALLDGVVILGQGWFSARVGEGLVLDLRTQVFAHVQRQPLAFFTRAQTGSLVSRLNTDVVGAQLALTELLSSSVSSVMALVFVLGAIFFLSWPIGVVAVVVLPSFLLPGRLVGSRLQRLSRESMQLNAEMGTLMTERFNVAGAILSKLYGRPPEEVRQFAASAGRVRDIGVVTNVYGRMLFVVFMVVTSLVTAAVYGFGGSFVIHGTLQIGSLVALAALLLRLYGPINQLSGTQSSFLTALVSFDRIFEILDLQPLIAERPGAVALPAAGSRDWQTPELEFDRVSFRYPAARDVSVASLEPTILPVPERESDAWALREVSFRAPAGTLTALVGPSGAGKTTLTHLVPRLYDPTEGKVCLGGHDLRDLTLGTLRDTVGMVTQDAHLFHTTIRSNLLYARPGATEKELIEACDAAQIWQLINSLPDGLDTMVGDRGYRLSGGEKQRVALARLLLKAPSVVVLDEATAHLDSESEAAVQRALKIALSGRTSLVIAHRLSTIREASQILVLDEGRIKERGSHEELLAAHGLYEVLYQTQFAPPGPNGGEFSGPGKVAGPAPPGDGWHGPPPPPPPPPGVLNQVTFGEPPFGGRGTWRA